MAKCEPGCTCKRHSKIGNSCAEGCTCGRHVVTDQRRARLSAARMGKPMSEVQRLSLKCQPGCDCAKHSMRNAGQFKAGSAGFTGRHSDETKKIIAETSRAQMERQFPGSSRRAAMKREHPGTHGSWQWMISRCFDSWNASYPFYGARGITVCERWLYFENFLEDMGDRPEGMSIDRIDPYGNYEPGNCRWATALEQAANRRRRVGGATPKRDSEAQ